MSRIRRSVLTAIVALVVVVVNTNAEAQGPNVIVIVADDLGYNDVGYQDSPDIKTPAIDALAADGVRVDQGYVAHSLCMPSRSGLMTGREPARMGIYTNPDSPTIGLPVAEKTLANVMKSAGYATAAIGKWQLGNSRVFHPNNRGFDYFYGFLGGSHSYYAHGGIQRNGVPVRSINGYLTSVLGNEALNFIAQHQNQPFFIYLAFNAPHPPLQAPEEYLRRYTNIADVKRRTYAAMVTAMDDAIAGVVAKVKTLNRQTLIIFLSDNGAAPNYGGSNTPLIGNKKSVFEGGIRVPMIWYMPGTLPASRHSDPVSSLDILPTLVDLVGGDMPINSVDGENIWESLKNNSPKIRTLHWIINENGYPKAIRVGDWKLIELSSTGNLLFDLGMYPPERVNQIRNNPNTYHDLQLMLHDWHDQLSPSLW